MGLAQAWYNKAGWLHLLRPLSALFCLISSIRRRLHSASQQRPAVPVIIVGNISVGGTGKTPVVVALADALEQQGWRVGVISRGYGGRARHYPLFVTPETDVRHSGDEARLMRVHLRGPLVLDPDRPRALQALLAQQPCDVVISDDGLQHYRLWRDIEIAVVDGARALGNGLCLPAGPLREPPARLTQVDHILVNGDTLPALPPQSAPADLVTLVPQQWVNVKTGQRVSLASFRLLFDAEAETRIKADAMAGIGNPARFFATLDALGFDVQPHVFADHHAYQPADLAFATASKTLLLMTEKDAVKCQRFAGDNWWYLQVKASLPAAFLDALRANITRLKSAAPALTN
ncbi:MAG: tetraacyldisaccharide 4'-kinase [Gammaproteobacteria bacterium]|nr:tetraacyldisaccharide 4'-kinase [Gammaproteobacteria bacterium]